MKPGQKVTPGAVLDAPATAPREQWLERRRLGLGGSDIGAILGLSRYRSAWAVYLDKRGQAPPEARDERLERAALWGHLHEDLLARQFTAETGLRCRRIGLLRNITRPWMLASLDRQVHGCEGGPCFLEIKNRSARSSKAWGPTGDPAGVPDNEALQTHWYMAVTGYGHGHVAVLLGGNDDRYYRVARDEDLISDVITLASGFWKRVESGHPPPPSGSDGDTELLGRLSTAAGGTTTEVHPRTAFDARDELQALTDRARALEGPIAEVKNRMRWLAGDAETVTANGVPMWTWKHAGAFSAKQLAERYPELAAKYTRQVTRDELDTQALAEAEPDAYRACRARVLRIAGDQP